MNTKHKPNLAQAKVIQIYAEHYLYSPEEKISKADKAKFSKFVHREYTKLKRLNIQEMRVSGQPYRDAKELFADFDQNRRIQVSTDFNNPAILDKEANLKYRYVHDVHHCLIRADFSWQGELRACDYFSSLTDDDTIHRVLRSELVYQAASYFYLGDFSDTQKIVLSDPRY